MADSSPLQKCLRCSQTIVNGDLIVFEHGDLIHLRCWQVMNSAEHIRRSRLLTERSKEQLEESRRRVQRVWEALGSKTGISCVICGFPVSHADLVLARDGVAHRACAAIQSEGVPPTSDC